MEYYKCSSVLPVHSIPSLTQFGMSHIYQLVAFVFVLTEIINSIEKL